MPHKKASHRSPPNLQQTRRSRLTSRAAHVRCVRVIRRRKGTGAWERRRARGTGLKRVELGLRPWWIVSGILGHHGLGTEIGSVGMSRVGTSITSRLVQGIILMRQLTISASAGSSCYCCCGWKNARCATGLGEVAHLYVAATTI